MGIISNIFRFYAILYYTKPMAELIPLPTEMYKSKLPFPSFPSGHRAIDWAIHRLPDLEKGTEILNSVIEAAREHHTKIIVLSPHEDDVPLSVGGLVTEFPPKNVYTITFFTRALQSAQTSDLKRYVAPGFSSVVELYEKRHEEDVQSNMTLGIPRDNQYHLGFIDAPWRTKANSNTHVYPFRESQFGRVAGYDRQTLMPQLQERLREHIRTIVGDSENFLIFAPAALGMTKLHLRPVDHTIIRDVAAAAFPADSMRDHVLYYGEYPYLSEGVPDKKLIKPGVLPALHAVPNQDNKHKAVLCHQSQVSRLFDPRSSLSVGAMPHAFPPEMMFVTEKNLQTITKSTPVTYYGSSK